MVGLIAQAFFLIPFGRRGGEDGFVVSVATGEAMEAVGGREGDGSLLDRFEAEADTLGLLEALFFEAPPLCVLTMAASLKLSKEKLQRIGKNKGADFECVR